MHRLSIRRETAEALERVARERGCTIDDLLASIALSPAAPTHDHPLIVYTLSAEFRVKFSDAERFLAILGWVAAQKPEEFGQFVRHLESRRKYVGLSAEEIRETCRHNQARQIPGTRYWAIMNLDSSTKRRFLRRLLVFVGEPDAAIDAAVATLGAGRPSLAPAGVA